MSGKNTKNEQWPQIGSLVCVNPGTRLLTEDGNIAIVPVWDEEITGIVIELFPACEYIEDQLDVLVVDRLYRVIRTPSPHPNIDPYFNLREIHDDGTSTKF